MRPGAAWLRIPSASATSDGSNSKPQQAATSSRSLYHTERGQSARYQRAWALHYSGDSVAAANEMESIADAAGDGSDRARHALLNGSSFAQSAEDPEQARRMLRRLGVAVEF